MIAWAITRLTTVIISRGLITERCRDGPVRVSLRDHGLVRDRGNLPAGGAACGRCCLRRRCLARRRAVPVGQGFAVSRPRADPPPNPGFLGPPDGSLRLGRGKAGLASALVR